MDTNRNTDNYSEPVLVDHGTLEHQTLGIEQVLDEAEGGKFNPESI